MAPIPRPQLFKTRLSRFSEYPGPFGSVLPFVTLARRRSGGVAPDFINFMLEDEGNSVILDTLNRYC
ncbi:hypothetical protein Pcinc_014170 [Petrolisthes cinctipes]|uniref:Uncharacterized protein n=1 Tax=Petrolisthes cinctipes TaxID=88211 RepID=A0AAE1KQY3_PETCI|nr:hypothetical protein Pcinc_014170 [Petrolisthes cinctipes]